MHEGTIISWGTEEYKQASLKKYGVDHPMKNKNVRDEMLKKNLETRMKKYNGEFASELSKKVSGDRSKQRKNRQSVIDILEIKNKYKLKLSRGWWMKSDEYVKNLLSELKFEYGE